MKLSDLVAGYVENAPALVLDDVAVAKHLKSAVRFYCGYAALTNSPPVPVDEGGDGIHTDITADNLIEGAQDFDLTPSEYAIIKPLFYLYVEKENAQHLEASRALGTEVFGRSVAEVENDIKDMEAELPHRAFQEDVIRI